jgi:hypothetical protein
MLFACVTCFPLQDPTDMTKLEIANFDHILRQMSDIGRRAHSSGGGAMNVGSETQRILEQVTARRLCLYSSTFNSLQVAEVKKVAPKFGTLVSEPSQLRKDAEGKNEFLRKGCSTGDVGSSFTSSSSSIVTHHTPADSSQLQIETAMCVLMSLVFTVCDILCMYTRVKKAGKKACALPLLFGAAFFFELLIHLRYVRLVTSLGMINLELRADLVPKTVHNFLMLCHKGYYNGTKFHRLVKGFMMQVIAVAAAAAAAVMLSACN